LAFIVFYSSTDPYSARDARSLLLSIPGMIDYAIIL